MDFNLLTELIDSFKLYQTNKAKNKKSSLLDFARWVVYQSNTSHAEDEKIKSSEIWQKDIEVGISKLFVHMYRYSKIHIRHSMHEFPELVNEDFTYLYTLVRMGSMTKTQLIEQNIHEKPSGMEIIKRLLHHNLIEESIDQNDKRSKQIDITIKGKEIYLKSQETTGHIAKLVSGNLSSKEKQTLFDLLKKLDHFHNPIYIAKGTKPIKQLLNEFSLN